MYIQLVDSYSQFGFANNSSVDGQVGSGIDIGGIQFKLNILFNLLDFQT